MKNKEQTGHDEIGSDRSITFDYLLMPKAHSCQRNKGMPSSSLERDFTQITILPKF